MKKQIILVVMLLIGTIAMGAQSLTIINNTSCSYNVWVSAHNGTNPCGSMCSNAIGVAPHSTAAFTNPAQFESSIGWLAGGPISAGFLWDYARINSGFNMLGICTCFTLTVKSITACSTIVHVTYASYSFGNVVITIDP